MNKHNKYINSKNKIHVTIKHIESVRIMDVNELKKIQNEVITKSRKIDIISISLWVLLNGILYIAKYKGAFYVIDTILIFSVGSFTKIKAVSQQVKIFNSEFKNVFVLSALSKIFTNLKYEPDKGLSRDIILNTKMLQMGDTYSSNDYFEAEYKNVKVKHADIDIERKIEVTSSDQSTSTYYFTVFKGKWMVFDFNKKFNSNIQVSQKGFKNSKISNVGEVNRYKKIKVEDSEFNKMFKIYAQNENDAFCVLTPTLIEKIKKLTKNIEGKILLCFIDNELHVGLSNKKDSFENSVYKKIDENKINNEISKDIKVITNFIDELILDNTVFKGEM